MKKKSLVFLILLLLIWLPTGIDLLLWNKLPAELPMHFNSQMIADSWGPKAMAVFILPTILTVAQGFIFLLIKYDARKNAVKDWIVYLVLAIMPIISFFLNFVILSTALGDNTYFQQQATVNLLSGIILIILGVPMNSLKPNKVIGIRLPWTMESNENWRLTHRLGSKTFICGGIFELVAAIFTYTLLFIPILVIVTLIPIIYSYVLYQKGI